MTPKFLILASILATTLAKSQLATDECLSLGESLISENKCFRLKLERSGNLVIEKYHFGKIWNAEIAGKGAIKACIQYDGNFVAYDSDSKQIWASDMTYHPLPRSKSLLTMQDDGNLVVYVGAEGSLCLWATNTVQECWKY